ncbi:MAG: hypothetical protein U9N19_01060 [Thermodesulfobacteriota bacterium]|nr:hypothetical protein [Thermodesulfobacteriota bacterium]
MGHEFTERLFAKLIAGFSYTRFHNDEENYSNRFFVLLDYRDVWFGQ